MFHYHGKGSENMQENALQNKIREALNCEFIGDVDFSDEIEQIQGILQSTMYSFNDRRDNFFRNSEIEYLIIAIVHYTRNWGSNLSSSESSDGDSQYWKTILFWIFDSDEIHKVLNKLYDPIEAVLINNGKKLFKSKGGKRMFVPTLMFHSFAPKSSIRELVRLIWGYYSDIEFLHFDYDEHSQIADRVSVYLESKFSITGKTLDEDVNLGGNTYSIRASLKYAFIYEHELARKIINTIFKTLNNLYWSGQVSESTHFEELINPFAREFIAGTKKRNRQKKVHHGFITDEAKITTFYEYNTEKDIVYIVIPEILLFNAEYKEAVVRICFGDVTVEKSYDIIGRELKRKLPEITIPLSDYQANCLDHFDLRMQLYFDGTQKYDSKNDLVRTFLLFNNIGREMPKNTNKPGDYYLLLPYGSKQTDDNKYALVNGVMSSGTQSLYADEDAFLSFSERRIFFNSIKKELCFVMNGKNKGIDKTVYIENEVEYQVYNSVTSIEINIEYKIDKVIVTADEKRYRLNEICREKSTHSYSIALSTIGMTAEGLHSICFDYGNKNLGEINYLIAPKLHITMQPNYVFEKSGWLTLYKNGRILNESTISNLDDEIRQSYYNGILVTEVPYIRFRLNKDTTVYYAPIKSAFFHKDSDVIHSGTTIEILSDAQIDLGIIYNNEELPKPIKGMKYDIGNYRIGRNAKSTIENIDLRIGTKMITIISIANEEIFISEPEIFGWQDKLLIIDFEEYIGNLDSEFLLRLKNLDTQNEYDFYFFEGSEIDVSQCDDGEYEAEIYLLYNDFGEIKRKKVYSDTIDLFLGNEYNTYFKDTAIELTNTRTRDKKIKFRERHIIRNISFIGEESYPLFSGSLQIGKQKFPIVFYLKSDSNIQILIVKDEDRMFAGIDKDKDCLTSANIDGIRIELSKSCYFKEI